MRQLVPCTKYASIFVLIYQRLQFCSVVKIFCRYISLSRPPSRLCTTCSAGDIHAHEDSLRNQKSKLRLAHTWIFLWKSMCASLQIEFCVLGSTSPNAHILIVVNCMFIICSWKYKSCIVFFWNARKHKSSVNGPMFQYYEWYLRTWRLSAFRVFRILPQTLQGIQILEMWFASMWSMIFILCPSFPHSLHILTLPCCLSTLYSPKVIMDLTFVSSSKRLTELLSAIADPVGVLRLLSLFGSVWFVVWWSEDWCFELVEMNLAGFAVTSIWFFLGFSLWSWFSVFLSPKTFKSQFFA